MTIFYNNKTLHDTLLIHISEETVTNSEQDGDVIRFYHDDKLVAININNVSQKMSSLKDGYIYLTDFLKTRIESITNVQLPENKHLLIVGKIIDIEPVENTHLNICKVNVGGLKNLQIVCGAANAREGLKVVVALDGCMLPNGKIIKSGSLMGIKSEGMLCSFKELNIQNEQKGIIELDDENIIGTVYNQAFSNLR